MSTHSGNTAIRMPSDLHAALAAEAQRQGVSLNSLMVTLLAGAIAWKQTPPMKRAKP